MISCKPSVYFVVSEYIENSHKGLKRMFVLGHVHMN
jgi:hypothetical protein